VTYRRPHATRDTINVGPASVGRHLESARIGKWLVHCHIPHHTTNNNVEEKGGGGLTMIIESPGRETTRRPDR